MVWTIFGGPSTGFRQKGNDVGTVRQYANGRVAMQGLG